MFTLYNIKAHIMNNAKSACVIRMKTTIFCDK